MSLFPKLPFTSLTHTAGFSHCHTSKLTNDILRCQSTCTFCLFLLLCLGVSHISFYENVLLPWGHHPHCSLFVFFIQKYSFQHIFLDSLLFILCITTRGLHHTHDFTYHFCVPIFSLCLLRSRHKSQLPAGCLSFSAPVGNSNSTQSEITPSLSSPNCSSAYCPKDEHWWWYTSLVMDKASFYLGLKPESQLCKIYFSYLPYSILYRILSILPHICVLLPFALPFNCHHPHWIISKSSEICLLLWSPLKCEFNHNTSLNRITQCFPLY